MTTDKDKTVSIIGAGFAGLTLALRLAQKGFTVDLYERTNRVGGLLGTDQTEFGIAEKAANALICTQKSWDLFTELQLTPSQPLPSARKRFLFRDHPTTWPLKFTETIGLIKNALVLLCKGRKKLLPQPYETMQDWGYRNLGQPITQYIIEPAMQGIYGNELSGLSARLILGPIFSRKKKDKYKGLLTGPGGMQDLVQQLEKKITALGVRVHLNSDVQIENLTGPVVICTAANTAAALLKKQDPDLSAILSQVQMSSLLSATVFFPKPQKKYQGFGCLIPRGFDLRALGILMNSYIFKDRDKTYNETWIFGGLKDADILKFTDDQIVQLICDERARILQQQDRPLAYRINRWHQALPYYDLNLEKVSQELDSALQDKNIFLHGNYLSGIGLSKILERSDLLAEQIAKGALSKQTLPIETQR